LRGRLLIGVISLVVVGLLIADVVTYFALQSFLLNRVDDQLKNGRAVAVGVLGGPGPGRGPSDQFPIGTGVELVAADGTPLSTPLHYDFPSSTSTALPVLPHPLPNAGVDKQTFLSLRGTGGVSQYQAAIWSEDSFQGNFVVLAIPSTDVQSTLSQLIQLEGLISVGVVVATAILALFIIRISLRPLEKMGTVANEIAAGDRVLLAPVCTEPAFELGRLDGVFELFDDCKYASALGLPTAVVPVGPTALRTR